MTPAGSDLDRYLPTTSPHLRLETRRYLDSVYLYVDGHRTAGPVTLPPTANELQIRAALARLLAEAAHVTAPDPYSYSRRMAGR